MKIYPSQFMAWALAQELNMDCCNLGDCEIDTESNTITFYGAVGPETATLPTEMKVEEYGQNETQERDPYIRIINSPKNVEVYYFKSTQYKIGKITPKE